MPLFSDGSESIMNERDKDLIRVNITATNIIAD